MLRDVIRSLFADLSLNKKLIFIMLFLNFILVSIILLMYSQTEQLLLRELQQQTVELTKAIQIGVEEITSDGITDEERLYKYLKNLNAKGIKEISVISNADEIVASTNTAKIGQPITHKRKELIIKAELGEPISEEGSTYNVIFPVIAGNIQYGYVHLKFNKDDFSKVVRSNTLKRIIATFFVFGVGIVLALLLSKQYTKPIKNVVEAARKVAMGNFEQNIPIYGKNEIGQLSESFNFMVQKLKEIRKLEERLREAEHLSGLGQFSRNMAHEIRNPLNYINLSIDYILEKYSSNDKKFYNLILGIKQEIQRLDSIVNNFLTYSKPLKLNLQDVDIKDSIEEIILLIWTKMESEGIVLKKDYRDNVKARLDRDLFKSCLLNVISNAIEAMEMSEKKELVILTEFKEEDFIISITDSGIGVLEKDIPKIFEPFFTTKEKGIGLGLSMTMRILEEHGGTVLFKSEKGKGSTISLILPKNILIFT